MNESHSNAPGQVADITPRETIDQATRASDPQSYDRQMIRSARGAAPFDRGRRAGLLGKTKRDNPFDNPNSQTQSGVTWERKASEWDEGWSAGNAERLENCKCQLVPPSAQGE
jgi:hypothetical protein